MWWYSTYMRRFYYSIAPRVNIIRWDSNLKPGFVYVIVGARVETDGGAESWGSWCTLL